ncbi:9491_t:CDS:2, partial [Paraglomus occultum]
MSLYARHLFSHIRSSSPKTTQTLRNPTLVLKRPVATAPLSAQFKLNPNMSAFNCLVHGETPPVDRVFTVEVEKTKTVAMLKKAIKEEKPNNFRSIDADQLALWKVSLPLDSSIEKVLKELVLEDNVTKGVQKLLPAKKLSSYFTEEPAEEQLNFQCDYDIESDFKSGDAA